MKFPPKTQCRPCSGRLVGKLDGKSELIPSKMLFILQLGIVQAGLILLAVIVILGSFFLIPGIAKDPQELIGLRDLWTALESSKIVDFFQSTIIPGFFVVFDLFIPDSIQVWFRSASV